MIENLRTRPIDFTDIPEVTKNTFKNLSGMAHLFKPVKQQITLRLDGDVIAWAKHKGSGYQSRINATLRKAMLADLRAGQSR